ncbi:MAG: thiaminase II [Chloroflexota bacterium]
MTRSTTFTAELWASITPVYTAILEHPFINGLTDGTLPEESFRYYVGQDAQYLREFSRCLAQIANKAPVDEWCEMFAGGSLRVLQVERALHEGFFSVWGAAPDETRAVELSPTSLAYTSYISKVAHSRPFEEAVAAVMPCYWIYWEVGKALVQRGSPNPLYQRWINTYASDEFAEAVKRVLETENRAVADLPESRKAAARRHFLTASRYEWMFWDAAWRREAWPV